MGCFTSSPAELTHRLSLSDLDVVCKLREEFLEPAPRGLKATELSNIRLGEETAVDDSDGVLTRLVGRHRRRATDRTVARRGNMGGRV